MADIASQGDRIEERDDLGDDDAARYAYWMAQDKIAEKEERSWIKKARDIVKRYRDERPATGTVADTHKFNILWSNVQTLLPTLYARTPKPDVQRRFADSDPTGRLASILLERCLSYSIEKNFDDALKAVVQDRLLPGRGVARVFYEPQFGDEIDDKAETKALNEDAPQKPAAEPLRTVDFEEVATRYVFWEDYREGPARQWIEVPWLRYRAYLTRDELTARFGKAKAKQVSLDFTPRGMDSDKSNAAPPDIYKKAIVDEVWDKSRKEVIWYAPGTPDLILDCKPDPLKLPEFFPSPDPLLATTTNDKRIPVPDFIEYQDQARELDKLTARIDKLTEALRVAGFYPGENKQALQQLFDAGTDNKLIPVQDWAAFMDKMGPNGFIVWLPIQQIAQTLIQLYNARDRVKALLYEITGLSDILRGATVPTETLGAQELKANFASRRISPQQKEVARFARDLLRLMGGVVSIHFSKETIGKITGYPMLAPVPPVPPKPMPPMQMMMGGMPPNPGMPGPSAPPPMPPAEANGAANGAGMPPGMAPPGAPPQTAPDPAMQAFNQAIEQWQQAAKAAQAVQQANAQKQAQFDAAVQLLKEDGPHGFRIDIESDSTIAMDEQTEKQSRVEFLSQMIPLMSQVIPLAQGNPALADLAKELTLFAARGFRVARQVEEVFEKAFEAIGKMPPNPKATGQDKAQGKAAPAGPQGPHPAELIATAALKSHEIDSKTQTKMAEIASKQQNDAANRNLKAAEVAGKHAIDQGHLVLDIERSANEHARDDVLASHRISSDAQSLS